MSNLKYREKGEIDMIFNYGPSGTGTSSKIDFDFGAKFDPTKHIKIKFDEDNDYTYLEEGEIENKYNLYIEKDIGWILLITATCEMQLNKTIKECDICVVGGGGGGGGHGTATFHNPSAGGGGGSGGQVKKILMQKLQNDSYKISIGQGGIGGVSEQKAGTEIEDSIEKNGTNGTNTQLLSLSSNNIIIEGLGGDGGQGARINDHGWSREYNETYGDYANYSKGSGGGKGKESVGFSPGGDGAESTNISSSGTSGSYLFENSIFSINSNKDYFRVAGGGGGGAGAQGDTLPESQGQSGEGAYGQGGLGGSILDQQQRNPLDMDYGHDGFSGLLAIRAKF